MSHFSAVIYWAQFFNANVIEFKFAGAAWLLALYISYILVEITQFAINDRVMYTVMKNSIYVDSRD